MKMPRFFEPRLCIFTFCKISSIFFIIIIMRTELKDKSELDQGLGVRQKSSSGSSGYVLLMYGVFTTNKSIATVRFSNDKGIILLLKWLR